MSEISYTNIANPRNNRAFSISLEHLPTAESVEFDGWLTAFADNFVSEWKGTPVYGRMDNLYTFQRTGRRISIAFDVVAVDEKEAKANQYRLNRLAQFLYPVYSADASPDSQVLSAAPLLRMSYSGLVQNAQTGEGLVGILQGFSYNPVIDSGPFLPKNPTTQEPELIFQQYSVQLEYSVLHTHMTGWVVNTDKSQGAAKYVFGADDPQLRAQFPHGGADKPQFDPMAPVASAAILGPDTERSALWNANDSEAQARQQEVLEAGGAGAWRTETSHAGN